MTGRAAGYEFPAHPLGTRGRGAEGLRRLLHYFRRAP
jgi:hypothetical protein